MAFIRSFVRRRKQPAAVIVTVVALGSVLAGGAPAAAAQTRPHAPVEPFLTSDAVTAPQFCSAGKPVSRTLTPILGVSSGAPAWNTGRPDLQAAYEVAPAGQPVIARATVRFDSSPAARYQVPAGTLTDGEYRFRVRAVDGGKASGWLPWCSFTVETGTVAAPATPTDLRVSADSYSGFQSCDSGVVPVVVATIAPTFAATIGWESPAPNVVARFEIARPGLATLVAVGNPYGVSVPAGSFSAGGSYQFRVRAEDGPAVSGWSPWCTFTAR
ncbi:hypothetical protein ACQP2E_12680 [Actinoplanes sp. CA-015351]|uniref:hypothetical protein n=1 Tax=Actinoplanes sp. CA-015351 TaxID=3239897 RepID=UPI003D9561F8